jgi:hypothetical protein
MPDSIHITTKQNDSYLPIYKTIYNKHGSDLNVLKIIQ